METLKKILDGVRVVLVATIYITMLVVWIGFMFFFIVNNFVQLVTLSGILFLLLVALGLVTYAGNKLDRL